MKTKVDLLEQQIAHLEAYIPQYAVAQHKVSKGSVGWHIAHSLIMIDRIIDVLKSSDPVKYRNNFKISRIVVLGFNIIPRGRAKSPKAVTPDEHVDEATLRNNAASARAALDDIYHLQRDQHFQHPILGTLNRRPAIKFLQVHTAHHLKIIKDILQTA